MSLYWHFIVHLKMRILILHVVIFNRENFAVAT